MSGSKLIGYNYNNYKYTGTKKYKFLEEDIEGTGSILNEVVDKLIEITGSSNIKFEISQYGRTLKEVDGIGEVTIDNLTGEFVFHDLEGNLVDEVEELLKEWKKLSYPKYLKEGFDINKFRITIFND